MSRYEIAELEHELKTMNDPDVEEDEVDESVKVEELMKDPEYRKFMEEMQRLCKLRHGVIKRYFEKNKYKKNARNEII